MAAYAFDPDFVPPARTRRLPAAISGRRALGATSYTPDQIQQMITQAANQAGVNPALALAVAKQESNFNPNAVNSGNKNGTTDYGVFQINSSNLQSMGLTNPLDPQQNITAGVNLLAQLMNQYNGNVQTALWAYNAGPGNVSNGVLPSSTQNYIQSVMAAIPSFGGTDSTNVDTTDSSVLDLGSSSGTMSLFGYDIPTTYVVGGGLALAGLLFLLLAE